MGYELHPVFRQTPQDGAVVSTDTWQAFSDLGGPKAVKIGHRAEIKAWHDVNRVARTSVRGFRLEVGITVDILNIVETSYLYDIVNRLGDSNWETEISMDAGGTYYPVVLTRFTGPSALAGRPFVGARFELSLEGAELLEDIPYLAAMALALPELSGPVLPPPGPGYKWRFFTVTEGGVDVTSQCVFGPLGWQWVPFVTAS